MLWVYGHYKYFNYSSGGGLYTSESDVYRRQILTYKDDPRAERINNTKLKCEIYNSNIKCIYVNQLRWGFSVNVNTSVNLVASACS